MSSVKRYVDVILPLALPRILTYSIPEELDEMVLVGTRLIVPIGKKKLYAGIAYKIHNQVPLGYQTKNILQVIDNQPIVYESQLKFWDWIADYYMCSVGEVLKAALPSGLKMESETYIVRNEIIDAQITEHEETILNNLEDEKQLTIEQLLNRLDVPNPMGVIKSLLDKQLICVSEKIESIYKPKTESYISLHPNIKTEEDINGLFDQFVRAKAQERALLAFLSLATSEESVFNFSVRKKILLEKAQISPSVISTMVEKAVFSESLHEVSRLPDGNHSSQNTAKLSPVQDAALRNITSCFDEHQVTLLYGVTSSGKTEIYIHLIEEQLKKGKQVLYLLPEIALTAQIINRLQKVFGKRVGVYHSKFSDSQRVEIYYGLLNYGENNDNPSFDIILGVRSSVYLPFKKLGLVIVDEEHENTYKQFNPAPRYNARDSAIMLANIHGAKVLLGTATPSIETFFNARSGKYGLVELKERHLNLQLPAIRIVNTKDARKKNLMKSHFSDVLINEIEEALQKKEQVILFQNRRGFAPFIECDECAWVPKCEHCDVSLTYHKHNNLLVCHYCGFAIPSPSNCMACGSSALQNRGFGTEKVEEELSIFFPNAKIERMDLDSTRSKSAYERIISSFEDGRIDILIGTQMVTKGLDFDRVSLVGILNADNMLNFPDFRAFERSYQLMAQVSGRAGRRNHQGLVIIQTAQPNHPVIGQVMNHDYMGLYLYQINERKTFRYPPFFRLISLTLKHRDSQILRMASNEIAKGLREKLGENVLGPESPPINRIQGLYLMNILIKINRDQAATRVKGLISYYINGIKQKKEFGHLLIVPDVDPM